MLYERVQPKFKAVVRILIALLASVIGFYPVLYFVSERFGILANKGPAVLGSMIWNSAFYLHISTGGLALMIGWVQFNHRLRIAKPGLHRNIGKIYTVMALVSSLSAGYIAFYAAGGVMATAGFLCLAFAWFTTTFSGYKSIVKRDIDRHRKMMVYSYAACLAAVSLRVLLPLLVYILNDFVTAYIIVAWACWIPNMIVAYLIVRNLGEQVQTSS